jgi:hypothetical protein
MAPLVSEGCGTLLKMPRRNTIVDMVWGLGGLFGVAISDLKWCHDFDKLTLVVSFSSIHLFSFFLIASLL